MQEDLKNLLKSPILMSNTARLLVIKTGSFNTAKSEILLEFL